MMQQHPTDSTTSAFSFQVPDRVLRRGAGVEEYEDCTANDPYNINNFRVPPAVVPLDYKSMRYYVCSVGNYCKLGMKFRVTIQPR